MPNDIRNHPRIIAALEARRQEADMPTRGYEAFTATLEQRPYDHHREDETYKKWDESIRDAMIGDYLPSFLRAASPEAIEAASAVMSSALVEIYRRAHTFGGKMHQNSPDEEISTWVCKLAQRCWRAPEQAVFAMFLHDGEKIVEITFDKITTDRDRVLNRVDLPGLTGKGPEDFTSEAVIEEARMNEARDAEAAKHEPWESNFYTGRSGRRFHLADVPDSER